MRKLAIKVFVIQIDILSQSAIEAYSRKALEYKTYG